MQQALEAIAEPRRRRILELVKNDELPAGEIANAFPDVSRPAISQHLKVLRASGLVSVRAVGAARLYQVDRDGLARAVAWFDQFADPWLQPLDALETELARGRRERRESVPGSLRRNRA